MICRILLGIITAKNGFSLFNRTKSSGRQEVQCGVDGISPRAVIAVLDFLALVALVFQRAHQHVSRGLRSVYGRNHASCSPKCW